MIPEILTFVTLTVEIPDKKSFARTNYAKIVLHQLEIPRPKTKTHGSFT